MPDEIVYVLKGMYRELMTKIEEMNITQAIKDLFENADLEKLTIFYNHYISAMIYIMVVMVIFMLIRRKSNFSNQFARIMILSGFGATFVGMISFSYSYNLSSAIENIESLTASFEFVRVALIPLIVGIIGAIPISLLNSILKNKSISSVNKSVKKELVKISKELNDLKQEIKNPKTDELVVLSIEKEEVPVKDRKFRRVHDLNKPFNLKKK